MTTLQDKTKNWSTQKERNFFFFQNVQKESKLKCKEQEGDMKKHEAYHGEKVDPSDYKGACSYTHFPFCL